MGETPNDYDLPRWAPRVPKPLIARLYDGSGKGLLDDRLVDDVGYRLLLRCESMLDVGLRYEGMVRCPKCKCISETGGEAGMITCAQCGWKCPWQAYNKTIKHKKLHAGGMTPFLEDFIKRFPLAKTSSEKMILIDTLIHRYHWESSDGAGRPGSVGLIEGKMKDIMPFLDKLSYGNHVPEGVEEMRAEWRKKWEVHPSRDRIARRQKEEREKRARQDV